MNKAIYWENREAGKRGQGVTPVLERYDSENSKGGSLRPRGVSRHPQPRRRFVGAYFDPSVSNHQRHLSRHVMRQARIRATKDTTNA